MTDRDRLAHARIPPCRYRAGRRRTISENELVLGWLDVADVVNDGGRAHPVIHQPAGPDIILDRFTSVHCVCGGDLEAIPLMRDGEPVVEEIPWDTWAEDGDGIPVAVPRRVGVVVMTVVEWIYFERASGRPHPRWAGPAGAVEIPNGTV